MKSKAPIITICSSAAFYRQAVAAQDQLEAHGLKVLLPISAERMKAAGDFTVAKSWLTNDIDYHKKAELMRLHFDKVIKGDAILVVNFDKPGQRHYIGPNVLMEMAFAFYHHKPIFILNELPTDSPFEEELKGMIPTMLHGKAEAVLDHLPPR